jgi:hypothetical protein
MACPSLFLRRGEPIARVPQGQDEGRFRRTLHHDGNAIAQRFVQMIFFS